MAKKVILYICGIALIAVVSTSTAIGIQMLNQQPPTKPTDAGLFDCELTHLHSINDSDNGTTIAIPKGDTLALTLPDYGDGGYAWVITSQDQSKISLTETSHENGTGQLGSFGSDVWRFDALETGSCTLTLVCQRPWATNDTCATFTAQIVIS